MFRDPVTSVETLRSIIGGEPSEVARRKELQALDVHARAFIANSPFLLLGTSSTTAAAMCRPKGTRRDSCMLDDHHLAIP
jgi:predicted pyridoxine 5'-phosphate oxidase superfamily flavin-nucleotide-binding protein